MDYLPHPVVSSFILSCANLLHSLIIWLIVLSLSSNHLHLLFCCLCFLWHSSYGICFVLLSEEIQFLFKDSYFSSHVHVFSCEILLVSQTSIHFFSLFFCFLIIFFMLMVVLCVLLLLMVVLCWGLFMLFYVDGCVVCIVSSGCNQSSFLFFCSTMWVGCQSRRFICLFWCETRQRILEPEISPYPEVGRGREREELTGDPDESSWRWTAERRAAESWRGTTDRGSQHRTPEKRGEAAWDRVQWQWVKMTLIPVALWNFR